MPTPTLDTRPDGALVIEADTADEALRAVTARLGADAEIVAAEKVHRGGWRGFFAHEAVQLVARPRTTGSASTAADERPSGAPDGVAAVLAALAREADDTEATFEDVLRRELAGGARSQTPPPASPEPTPAVDPAPAPALTEDPIPTVRTTAPRPLGPASVGWHVDELRDLRVPEGVVAACEGLDPADDTGWVMAIAGAVSSWCRPLPQGNSILVGPRAHRLGREVGATLVEVGAPARRSRSVALRVTGSQAGRRHLGQARGRRWGHLVAGGAHWEGLLLEEVAAISWVGDETLPDALGAAGRLGLVLGYGLGAATGNRPVRATPIDVALTIRSLLPRPLA